MKQLLHIVMYHYVRDLKHNRYKEIKGMDLKMFVNQVNFLKEHFRIVTMEQVIEAVENRNDLPENAMLLTFDDGYIDHYTFVLPILVEAQIQGSFFIPGKTFSTHQLLDVNKIHYILASANIHALIGDIFERMNYYRGQEFDYPPNEELFQRYAISNRFDCQETIFVKRILQTALPEQVRSQISSDLFKKYVGVSELTLAHELYMTEDQIRLMKLHGMFIGIHGYDHYWLGNLSPDQMRKDVSLALDVMDGIINRKHWVMNYPYGSYNADVVEYIARQGACLGLTTEVRPAVIGKDNALLLPRLDCNDFPPKSENYRKVALYV